MTVESRTPVAARMAGTALTIASAIGFGTSGPLARMAMDAGMTALQVATVRITLAAVLLAATLPLRGLSGLRGVRWRTLTGYALLAVVGVQVLFFIAVARIPVGIAMTLEFTAPVLVSLWIRVVRRIRLPVHVWTGITLATAGLAVVAQIWDGFRLDLIGLLAGLGTGLCTAGYYLLGEHIAGRADPLALTTCGMVLGAVAIGFVCPPWTIPMPVLATTGSLGAPLWSLLVALVVLSTVLPYVLGVLALRHLSPALAAVLGLIEPVVAAAMAWLLLGQSLTAMQMVGAVVLLGGAALAQIASAERPAPAQPLVP